MHNAECLNSARWQKWNWAYWLVSALTLGTLHSYVVLEQGYTGFVRSATSYQASRSESWEQLLQISHRQGRVVVLIAAPFSIASVWFVKTCLLWFLCMLFDSSLDFRGSVTLMGVCYAPMALLSLIGLVILCVDPLAGDLRVLDQGSVEATFVTGINDYFARLQEAPALKLTAASRVTAEMTSAAMMIYRLDSDAILTWRKGLICASVIGAIVHFPTLWAVIRSAL
ncbi:MAG TPA: hypothetical protein VKM94_15770 [Blastocatellia bacterium]|nr:hypothetical protein [Blastocatellia bacterium]